MTAQAVETNQRPWGITLIMGIMAMVFGALLLFGTFDTKLQTYMFLVTLLGLYILISGIIRLVSMFQDHTMWGWKLIIGIIEIVAGASVLLYPVYAAIVLPQLFVLMLGIWMLIDGIVMLIMAFSGAGWGAGILGVLVLIFGVILLGSYGKLGSGLSFLWAAAVCGLVFGFFMIIQAFRERAAA